MRQGTRTRGHASGRWVVGVLAITGLTALIAVDMSRDGVAWQAGPLEVSMDMKADQGLAITFQRLTPTRVPGFADNQSRTGSSAG